VSLLGRIARWRRRDAAREFGAQCMQATLVDDCERLVTARRELAANDQRPVAALIWPPMPSGASLDQGRSETHTSA
jgi:hypothetical protein